MIAEFGSSCSFLCAESAILVNSGGLVEDLSARIEKLKELSPRQREVLGYMCEGLPYAQIAGLLVITERTVLFHVGKIYEKLGIAEMPKAARQRELGRFCPALRYIQDQGGLPDSEPAPGPEQEPEPSELALEDVSRDDRAIQLRASPFQQTERRSSGWLTLWLVFLAVAIIGGVAGGGVMIFFSRSATLPTSASQPAVGAPTGFVPSSPATASLPASSAPAEAGLASICGESGRAAATDAPRFLRSQGVSDFTAANTQGAVRNDRVRAVAIDTRGLWIGYFATDQNPRNGIGQYDKKSWADCTQPGSARGRDINAIAFDRGGGVWAATENAGVLLFDGKSWYTYTTRQGLPSDRTYGLFVDEDNTVWVATWEGIAKFDRESNLWELSYSTHNNTLFNDHVHAIAKDSSGSIWVGHIMHGVSQYRAVDGKWIYHRRSLGGLGGDEIRSIVVRKATTNSAESVWFATADGGVSRFENGAWTIYRAEDGLPSDDVRAVALDKYNRVWAATAKGVVYFDDKKWTRYDSLDTHSLTFGPQCQDCPFDDDTIWTGTVAMGLTHSRIPYPDAAVDILKVCFVSEQRESICQSPQAVDQTDTMTVTYTRVVSPGDIFRFEVTASPRAPYQFREDRGDFLSSIEESDANLFSAYPIIPVKGTIDPGEPFTFTDFDNPIKAPRPADGEREMAFTSAWRVWAHTRYAGPTIRIRFIVRRP
jgi:DNA-binding CsgD family transcriptional regulator